MSHPENPGEFDHCNQCRKTKCINNNLKVHGKLDVRCDTHLERNLLVNGNETVNGTSNLNTVNIANDLTVNGSSVLNGDETVNGTSNLNTVNIANDLTVDGQSVFNGDVIFNGNVNGHINNLELNIRNVHVPNSSEVYNVSQYIDTNSKIMEIVADGSTPVTITQVNGAQIYGGSFDLIVSSTSRFPATGQLSVITNTGAQTLNYTGKTGVNVVSAFILNGVMSVYGSPITTVTGQSVSGGNIASGTTIVAGGTGNTFNVTPIQTTGNLGSVTIGNTPTNAIKFTGCSWVNIGPFSVTDKASVMLIVVNGTDAEPGLVYGYGTNDTTVSATTNFRRTACNGDQSLTVAPFVLNVNQSHDFALTGSIAVETTSGWQIVTYSGIGINTFTGCVATGSYSVKDRASITSVTDLNVASTAGFSSSGEISVLTSEETLTCSITGVTPFPTVTLLGGTAGSPSIVLTLAASTTAVCPGMIISGPGIILGTYILSGSGSTYRMSNINTIAAGASIKFYPAVVYTGTNRFIHGQLVNVTGLSVASFNFIANCVMTSDGTSFTVASDATGLFAGPPGTAIVVVHANRWTLRYSNINASTFLNTYALYGAYGLANVGTNVRDQTLDLTGGPAKSILPSLTSYPHRIHTAANPVNTTVANVNVWQNNAVSYFSQRGQTLPPFDVSLVSTTISNLFNEASLPNGTIPVVSTAGFPVPLAGSTSTILVETTLGIQTVKYSGLTATTFTGCQGGTGIVKTGNSVVSPNGQAGYQGYYISILRSNRANADTPFVAMKFIGTGIPAFIDLIALVEGRANTTVASGFQALSTTPSVFRVANAAVLPVSGQVNVTTTTGVVIVTYTSSIVTPVETTVGGNGNVASASITTKFVPNWVPGTLIASSTIPSGTFIVSGSGTSWVMSASFAVPNESAIYSVTNVLNGCTVSGGPFTVINGASVAVAASIGPIHTNFGFSQIELYEPNVAKYRNGKSYPVRIPVTSNIAQYESLYGMVPIAYFDNVQRTVSIKVPDNSLFHLGSAVCSIPSVPPVANNFNTYYTSYSLTGFEGTFAMMTRDINNNIVKSSYESCKYLMQASPTVVVSSVNSTNIDNATLAPVRTFPMKVVHYWGNSRLNNYGPLGNYLGITCPLMSGENPNFDIYNIPSIMNANVSIVDPILAPLIGSTLSGDASHSRQVENFSIPSRIQMYDNPLWSVCIQSLPIPVLNGDVSVTYPENVGSLPLPGTVSSLETGRMVFAHEFAHSYHNATGAIRFTPTESMATGAEMDTRANNGTFGSFRAATFNIFNQRLTRALSTITFGEAIQPVASYGLGSFWTFLRTTLDKNQQVMRRYLDILNNTAGTIGKELTPIQYTLQLSSFIGAKALDQALNELYGTNYKTLFQNYAISLCFMRNNTSIPPQYRHNYPYWMFSKNYPGLSKLILAKSSIANNVDAFPSANMDWWEMLDTNAPQVLFSAGGSGSFGGPIVAGLTITNGTDIPCALNMGTNFASYGGTINVPTTSGNKICYYTGVGTTSTGVTITNVSANGVSLTYTAANTFSIGNVVTIVGVVSNPPNIYNLSNVTIALRTATTFTVNSTAFGTYVSGGSVNIARFNGITVEGGGSFTSVAGTIVDNCIRILPPALSTINMTDMTTINYQVTPFTGATNVTVNIASGEYRLSLVQFTSDGGPSGTFLIDGPYTVNGPGSKVFNLSSPVNFTANSGKVYLVCTNVTMTPSYGVNQLLVAEPISGSISSIIKV